MRWLAVVLFLCSCGSPRASGAPLGLATSRGAAPGAQRPDLARPLPPASPLERGKDVERTIKGGEVHRLRIQLQAGQVALGVVMQDGIDLALTTFDAAGKKVAEFDSPNGNSGPEPFAIEAPVAGAYDVEVKPFAEAPPAGAPAVPPAEGRYKASVNEILTADAFAERKASERIASPRILELWRAVRQKRPNAATTFWDEIKGKAPIVEPYPGDPKSALVTFVFRSTMPYVGLFGGTEFREKPMVRAGDTDVWYLSARVPTDARLDYAFVPAESPPDNLEPFQKDRGPNPRWTKKQLDPNNPRARFDLSRVELPGAPPQPWIEVKADAPKGKITALTIASKELKETRKIGVYTPAGFDPKQRYPLVIAFDGEIYGMEPSPLVPLPTILDNLIAAKRIPPVVAVLVASQATRDRDLPGSAPFAAFVAKELVPKMRADYRAGLTPDQTLVTGSSLGGLCSMYTGFRHSEVIGLVLSNSGSFQFVDGSVGSDVAEWTEGGALIRDVGAAPRKPLEIYLDAGRFEMGLLASNRQMRDVLVAKGYRLTYAEFSGGHDYWIWRGTIADGLIALLRKR